MMSVVNVEDSQSSTRLLAQTTLRNILGMKTLTEILSDRDSIAHMMQVSSIDRMSSIDTHVDSSIYTHVKI